jgi:hypothetical protein
VGNLPKWSLHFCRSWESAAGRFRAPTYPKGLPHAPKSDPNCVFATACNCCSAVARLACSPPGYISLIGQYLLKRAQIVRRPCTEFACVAVMETRSDSKHVWPLLIISWSLSNYQCLCRSFHCSTFFDCVCAPRGIGLERVCVRTRKLNIISELAVTHAGNCISESSIQEKHNCHCSILPQYSIFFLL